MTTRTAHLTARPAMRDLIASLNPIEDSEDPEIINAVIETPQGSRNKYKYDPEMGLFKLSKVLPAGSEFP